MLFAQRERIIRSECNALRSEKFEQQPQRVGIVDKRIDKKTRRHIATRKIASWVFRVVDRNQIRADMKCVFDSSDREWERAAAMREGDAKFRKSLEHAAKNHRADRERRFGRHSDEPRQPVIRHALSAEHVPWVNEDRPAKLLGHTPDRLQ